MQVSTSDGVITVSMTGLYQTLAAGEAAARAAGDHNIVVDAGTYNGNLTLTAADNGLTITANAGAIDQGTVSIIGGSNIAVEGLTFDGSGSAIAVSAINSTGITVASDQFNDVGQAVKFDGTSNSIVTGGSINLATGSAVELDNGANQDTVYNLLINDDQSTETNGAIFAHGTNALIIDHSQIEDTMGAAISLADFYGPGNSATENQNTIISNNVIKDADTAGSDSGAIYIEGRSQVNSGDTVTSNYISGGGAAGEHAVGLYLDDNASGVTATNNIFALGSDYSDAFEIHGGSSNTLKGNIFDLGTSAITSFGLFQQDEPDQQPQGSFTSLTNDVVTNNIYTSESATPRRPAFANETGSVGSGITIHANDYWDYAGTTLDAGGMGANGDNDASYAAPASTAASTLTQFATYTNQSFAAINTSNIGLVNASANTVSATAPASTTSATTPPTSVTIGSGSDTLVLAMSEDAYQGDAQFTISLDGTQIGGTQTTFALHSAGSIQQFDVLGNFASGSHSVSIDFLNDDYGGTPSTDRNLYLNGATIDGVAVAGAALTLDSAGSQSFNFVETTGPVAPTTIAATPNAVIEIGSGSDTLALHVSEDAYQGDAKFTIAVDGVQIGGTQTATALHSTAGIQEFDVSGNFSSGAHSVSVDFLNDAYGGTPTTDRNLYVDSATIDGKPIAGASLTLDSAGPQSFSFIETGAPSTGTSTTTSSGTITVSVDGPYKTLQAGEAAARAAGYHNIVVEGGTYSGNLTLTSADNGLTITGSAGVIEAGTVSITGASNIAVTGLTFNGSGSGTALSALNSIGITVASDQFSNVGQAVKFDGTSGSSITGITVNLAVGAAIELDNGSNNDTIYNSTINGDQSSETTGAIYAHGTDHLMIDHNVIQNTAGAAISLADFYEPGNPATENQNATVANNIIYNADYDSIDSGAIYILGRNQTDTGDTITMNFISGGGTAGEHSVGLYLDDNASGVVATNNIFNLGSHYSDAFEIHGGSGNTLKDNIFDLGTSATTSFGLVQQDEPDQQPQGSFTSLTKDVVTNNIYATESATPRIPGFVNAVAGASTGVTITANDFWAYTGAALDVGGTGANGDSGAHYNKPAASAATTLAQFGAYVDPSIGFTAINTSGIGHVN